MLRAHILMARIVRQTILFLILGVVLFGPLFEAFDSTNDLEQGTDIVLVLLATFVSIALFTVCKRIILAALRFLFIDAVASYSAVLLSNRSTQVEILPPRSTILLASLRI